MVSLSKNVQNNRCHVSNEDPTALLNLQRSPTGPALGYLNENESLKSTCGPLNLFSDIWPSWTGGAEDMLND